MSAVLTTTDDVCNGVIRELKARLPDVPVKELPLARDLWGCLADKYLGEWVPVASNEDEHPTNRDDLPGPALWSLDRRTQYDAHLHVRGTFRYVVDDSQDEPRHSAQTQAAFLAEQIAVIGKVHEIMLVREPDTDVPYGSTVHLLLLAQVESHYRDYIRLDDRRVAWLTDTQIKVREIVLDYLCYGWSVLTIFHQHYNSPPLEKIHAALTYFDNHRVAVLKEIEEADTEADRLCRELENPQTMAKLRAAKAARQ